MGLSFLLVDIDDYDAPKESYMKLREGSLQNYLKPFEYNRVCYFANWAGEYRRSLKSCRIVF